MSYLVISSYRIMWLFVFFDLPVKNKKQRRDATLFRKNLEKDGFSRFQYSTYLRHCPSKESLQVHIQRVKKIIPNSGKISLMSVTDKQYSNIINFSGRDREPLLETPRQLEFF